MIFKTFFNGNLVHSGIYPPSKVFTNDHIFHKIYGQNHKSCQNWHLPINTRGRTIAKIGMRSLEVQKNSSGIFTYSFWVRSSKGFKGGNT